MAMPFVTSVYAGLLALLFVALSWQVIAHRRSRRVSLGDGGDASFQRRIRAHGNFVEYAPLGLVLLMLLEADGTGRVILHVLGLMLLTGRVLHAAAFSGYSPHLALRTAGMLLTLGMLILAGAALILQGLT